MKGAYRCTLGGITYTTYTFFGCPYAALPTEHVYPHCFIQHHNTKHLHTSTSAVNKYIQPYLHKVFAWTKHNNLTLNPDKTTYTLFTPDSAEYYSNLDLKRNNTLLPMETHPKVLVPTLDQKLIYRTHIHNISVHA